MPIPSTQDEIIKQYLLRNGAGTESTERVKIPGFGLMFKRPTGKGQPKETTIRHQALKEASQTSFAEMAACLADVADPHRGVVSCEWRLGTDVAKITYYEGYTTGRLTEREREDFAALLHNALRARANLLAIKFEFGSSVVEFTYPTRP